jgi:hypothetical protein
MKAHEGTLRHMERQALDRGEGELERTENPGAVQYYEKKVYGKSHRYYKADPFEGIHLPSDEEAMLKETLDLTEWNKQREEFHKGERQIGSNTMVYCPSCKVNGGGEVFMVYATETVISNAGNMPAKREVQCRECGRTGKMLL